MELIKSQLGDAFSKKKCIELNYNKKICTYFFLLVVLWIIACCFLTLADGDIDWLCPSRRID